MAVDATAFHWSAQGAQLLALGDGAQVLVEVAADLGVVAQRMELAPEEVVGNPPLRQGAEGEGGGVVADHGDVV